jgi:hypothetical protein
MKVRIISVEKLSSIFKPIEFSEQIYYCTLVGSNLVGFPADKKFKIIEPMSKDHVIVIKKRENLLLGTKLYDVNEYTVALVYSNRLTSATGLKTCPYIALIKENYVMYLREIGTKMDNEINDEVVFENVVKEEIDGVINAIEELMRKGVTLKRIERDAVRFWELYNKYMTEVPSKKKVSENVKTIKTIEDELDLDLSDVNVNVSSESDNTLL